MFAKYHTNFYTRKDADDLLWSGLSVNIPGKPYNSYKISCFISKEDNGEWKPGQCDLIIFDKDNNMYRITRYYLSQLYNSSAKDKEIAYVANLSKPDDKYLNVEVTNINLNELLVKKLIDELKLKTEHSFGVNITI